MSRFRRPADMLLLRPKLTLLPARYVDNTMPRMAWHKYDTPSWLRLGKSDPLRAREVQLPCWLRRQAQ